jgi:hypothetical protein
MTLLRAIVATLVIGASAANAGLDCTGVLDFEEGKAHFRCRFAGERLRRVRAVCRDGQPGCDADGACNGSCRFALCADRTCRETFGVDVRLRRGGRRRASTVFETADAKVLLRCLPRRGACPGGGLTTTTVPSTTTTTLPARACTVTLAGAVEGRVPCTAALERSGLGLPLLRVVFEGTDVSGAAAALLISGAPGAYRLGGGVILAVVGLGEPPLGSFQGVREDATHQVLVRIDAVDGTEVHGSLDAALPPTAEGAPLRLVAEF